MRMPTEKVGGSRTKSMLMSSVGGCDGLVGAVPAVARFAFESTTGGKRDGITDVWKEVEVINVR